MSNRPPIRCGPCQVATDRRLSGPAGASPTPGRPTGRRAAAPPTGTTDRRPSGPVAVRRSRPLAVVGGCVPCDAPRTAASTRGWDGRTNPHPVIGAVSFSAYRLSPRGSSPPLERKPAVRVTCFVKSGQEAFEVSAPRPLVGNPSWRSGSVAGRNGVAPQPISRSPDQAPTAATDSDPRVGGGSPRPCGAGHGCQAGAPHPRIPATSSTKPLVGRLDLLLYGSIPHAEQGRRGRTTGAVHAHGDPGCRGVRTTGAPGPPILQSSVRRVHDARHRGPPGHVREHPMSAGTPWTARRGVSTVSGHGPARPGVRTLQTRPSSVDRPHCGDPLTTGIPCNAVAKPSVRPPIDTVCAAVWAPAGECPHESSHLRPRIRRNRHGGRSGVAGSRGRRCRRRAEQGRRDQPGREPGRRARSRPPGRAGRLRRETASHHRRP